MSTRASTGTVLNGDDLNHDARICNIALLNQPYYTCASGTSMATPHVSGAAAFVSVAYLMRYFRVGRLDPFAIYCAAFGILSLILLSR